MRSGLWTVDDCASVNVQIAFSAPRVPRVRGRGGMTDCRRFGSLSLAGPALRRAAVTYYCFLLSSNQVVCFHHRRRCCLGFRVLPTAYQSADSAPSPTVRSPSYNMRIRYAYALKYAGSSPHTS